MILLLFVTGCQAVKTVPPLAARHSAADIPTQMTFWRELADQPAISNDDAFHALLIYTDGSDPAATYDDRVTLLKSRRVLSADFSGAPDDAADRGTLAFALVRMLNLRGGLTMSLLGTSPRYAVRTLQYRGLYPLSSTNQTFTGQEFIGVLGRVEDFQRGDAARVPAAYLPGEMHKAPKQDAGKRASPVEDLAAGLTLDQLVYSGHPAAEQRLAKLLATDVAVIPALMMITAEAPATSPVRRPLKIVITGFEGSVQYRKTEQDAWQAVRLGLVLDEEAELETAPKSAVRFIMLGQTYTLDRNTRLKVAQAVRDGKKVTTQVVAMQGRVRVDVEPINRQQNPVPATLPTTPEYQIEEAGLEHTTTIRTSNSSLAIRGTRVSILDTPPFAAEAASLTGRAFSLNVRGQEIPFGGPGQGLTRVRRDKNSAVEVELDESVIDTTLPGGRTEDESALVAYLISRGATVEFDQSRGIPIVRGGSVPRTDAELSPNLPGTLNFVLRWSGDANLDFAVGNQAGKSGELLFPAPGLTKTPSGGRVAFDHQGGSGGGIEVSFWPTPNFPRTAYPMAAVNVSGKATSLDIDVFNGNKRVQIFDTELGRCVNTYHVDNPQQTEGAIADLGGNLCQVFSQPRKEIRRPIDRPRRAR